MRSFAWIWSAITHSSVTIITSITDLSVIVITSRTDSSVTITAKGTLLKCALSKLQNITPKMFALASLRK